VEKHEQDPRESIDPWQQAAERWSDVGDKLKDRYRDVVGEEGPSEDQVRQALKTLGSAVQAVFESVGAAMRDPDTRTQVKDAAAGFASAVGQTFSDLGEEIRRTPEPETAQDEERPEP
jgi:hypothetical protein